MDRNSYCRAKGHVHWSGILPFVGLDNSTHRAGQKCAKVPSSSTFGKILALCNREDAGGTKKLDAENFYSVLVASIKSLLLALVF